MSMDLRELYQEVIIDHNKNPRNHHVLPDATHQANGFNPLCGDKLTVYLVVTDGIITQASFLGQGCAISQASASMMTELLLGKTQDEAHRLFNTFHELVTSDGATSWDALDKLNVLAGVRAYPARVKCATLAWHTLEAALKPGSGAVSTE